MQNAIAFANNDVITIAWSYGHKLQGCMGFAVYRVDAARYFVTWHTRILKPRPSAIFHDHIAVTNPARLHLHANLPNAGFGDVALYQFKSAAGFADLRRLHFGIHRALLPASHLRADKLGMKKYSPPRSTLKLSMPT